MSGQKQNWGREWTSVQAGLSKGLVPTLIVSVGTNDACSVETEPLHKLFPPTHFLYLSLSLYFTEKYQKMAHFFNPNSSELLVCCSSQLIS